MFRIAPDFANRLTVVSRASDDLAPVLVVWNDGRWIDWVPEIQTKFYAQYIVV